ncbi:six-hairpin glycosidase [Paraphoma chrysanthemicola]|nr:six-hairpin glycosidase [Paraphoma chrysanthemicola]
MRTASVLAFVYSVRQAHALLDADALAKQYFGNDAPWYRDRIPFFESSDKDITDVYYYRWNIFRAHQRDLGANGFISTEFLDDVSWQTNPWASLNDATGFHLLEGRWCRDRRFKEDYATFILGPNSNTRQFSEIMAAAVWQGYLVDGVASDAIARLDRMQTVFNAWSDSFDTSKGLYHVEPIRDATEYTISSIDASNGTDGFFGGYSFRPSINSYQFANAKAIASLSALKGGSDSTVQDYNSRAAAIKSRVQNSLWNSTFEHFIDRYQQNNNFVKYWDFIRGRELVGFVPWTHGLPDDTTEYAEAWKHALNSSELLGEHGLRTVEPSYQYYMRQYRYEGTQPECQWNGPSWPFQTTQVISGLANFLNSYPTGASTGIIGASDHTRFLKQYAQLHYNPERGGILDLEEDYYPDTGYPIVGLKRSPHYFHSGFVDLVLSGLVGIRPSADDVLEVNPLIDSSTISYFRADRVIYHGHEISVQWDASGSRYGATGLQVEVDGKVVASSPTLARLSVPLSRTAPAATTRRIAKSIQLSSTTAFPKGSVSVTGVDARTIYGSIDGRIWFFPETDVANGWSTPVGNATELWFQIDFGAGTSTSAADLAFFAEEGQGFDVPESYRIQVATGDSWVDASGAKYGESVANGITEVSWADVTSSKVRVVFTPKSGKKVRLVEFKVY